MNGVAALMKRQDGGGGVVVDGRNAKRMKRMAGRGIAAAEDQVGAAAQGPRRELRLLSDASVACVASKSRHTNTMSMSIIDVLSYGKRDKVKVFNSPRLLSLKCN